MERQKLAAPLALHGEAALVAEGRTELFMPMYLMLLLMFFAYCYPIARFTATLERRFAVKG